MLKILQRSKGTLDLELSNNEIKSQMLSEKAGSNKGKLIPTDIGSIVNDFLVSNFEKLIF